MIQLENQLHENLDFPVEIFLQDSDCKPIWVEEHWHSCFEILYLVKGEARHRINGIDYIAKEGELVILLPGSVHGIYCDDSTHTQIYVLKFLSSVLDTKFQKVYQSQYLAAFMSEVNCVSELKLEQRTLIEAVFESIGLEWREEKKGYQFWIRGAILQFVAYLMREGILKQFDSLQSKTDTLGFERIIQWIDSHYGEDLNLEDVARKLHLDYYYTSKYFKKMTGKNFKQYLDFVRIAEFNRMLIESNKSITEIAGLCGFASPQAMNRIYKRIMGSNPRKIRKKS